MFELAPNFPLDARLIHSGCLIPANGRIAHFRPAASETFQMFPPSTRGRSIRTGRGENGRFFYLARCPLTASVKRTPCKITWRGAAAAAVVYRRAPVLSQHR